MPNYLKILLCCLFASLISACGGGGGSDSDSENSVNYGDLSGACSLRVTNGEQCSSSSGPTAVVVGFDSSGQGVDVCTGALITPSHILTAGHCLEGVSSLGVRIGDERRFASRVARHPKYSSTDPLNVFDVAVLTLTQPINGTTIPLLVSKQVENGEIVNISGFGKDENGQSFGSGADFKQSLHKGEMKVSRVSLGQGIFEADFSGTGESVCSGDSGGPAIQLNVQGIPGIAGIALAVAEEGTLGEEPTCLQGSTAGFSMIIFPEVLEFIQKQAPGVGAV